MALKKVTLKTAELIAKNMAIYAKDFAKKECPDDVYPFALGVLTMQIAYILAETGVPESLEKFLETK